MTCGRSSGPGVVVTALVAPRARDLDRQGGRGFLILITWSSLSRSCTACGNEKPPRALWAASRLLVRAEDRRKARVARGLPESPIKVTFTAGGDLDPGAKFFAAGGVEKIVYCSSGAVDGCRKRLGDVATVVDAGDPVDLDTMLADLADRGVQRLMVEGGGTVHTQFLTAGLADELQLVTAPFFVGDSAAPRFVGTGQFPHHPGNRMTLEEVRPIGDVILARYLLTRS
ncbi:deaminase [Actinomadura darangshiensis]|uniref:Deaminase n=2 Tax=Actinomadura darangshiensis TaxID=705336 RepID=A0A4R5AZT9_9ACTN|nr:deaminase [Actinomadura darangshiensis]